MKNSLTSQTVGMIPYSDDAANELILELMFQETVSKRKYLNVASAFDTETSSFIDEQDGEESALCYIWMYGIENTVVYGRTLDEFVELCKKLNEYLTVDDVRLVTYIHFAKFDFSFIKFLLHWDHVFLKENREVLYADYGNIEFRDSLVLSGGRSLESIGKNLRKPVHKAVGDLDYELIRHNKTPLTPLEMHYCEMDIRVLVEYIREKMEDDGDISQIPYTNTGYVRRYVRNECFKNRRSYSYFIAGLTMTPACYLQAQDAFQGGSVSANFRYIGQTCENVHSYDIKSSYPYVMCCEYYPINYFTPVTGSLTSQTIEHYLTHDCCLFNLELWDVEPKYEYYFPISKHKCHNVISPTADTDYQETAGGRIISALYLSLNCTELDFDTIKRFYKFSKYRITNLRISPRGYLPAPIVKSIVKFFNDKTTLDGVTGREREYMISKNMLNAIYGMMVEKPIRPIFGFVNDYGFTKDDADFVQQIDSYNEKFNRFLFYPWGVWVTAHARHRLHEAIEAVGDDFRYCDTDSVKFVGDNHTDYFEKANKIATEKLLECSRRFNIPESYIIPCSPSGKRKVLGVWEHECDYKRFKTLGAKRYLVEFPNGEVSLTVAGTNKDQTLYYLINEQFFHGKEMFENFNSNLVVPAEYAKRTVSKFIDHERTGWVTDYLGNRAYYESPSGIYVAPTTYSFSITDEMKDAVLWLTHDGHYQDGQI